MNIGLINVDGHNFPNLALMKLSAWHKVQGDTVDWWWGFGTYDWVYMSKVFDEIYSPDIPEPYNATEVIKGGTGYDLQNRLPDEIEHIMPDYGLYNITDTAYGFLTRGCPRRCNFCIVSDKEGLKSRKVADLTEFWNGQRLIKLLDPNLLACPEHLNLLSQLADSGALVDFTQGLDARLLTEENITALNAIPIQKIHFAWDYMSESDSVLRGLQLYAKRAKHKPHGSFGGVYVLTNYNTSLAEDLYRIRTLIEMQYYPYVMVYDKPHAPLEIKQLQRWCNAPQIRKTIPNFSDYKSGVKAKHRDELLCSGNLLEERN